MKNPQLSRIITTAILTTSLLWLGGCNRWSQEEQNQATIQNIKTHTIQRRYGDRCIAILAAEDEGLRTILQATGISVSDSNELKQIIRRYTLVAIQSRINAKNPTIQEYRCTIFGEKTPLNPPMIDVIQTSQSLSPADRDELLRQVWNQKN